MVMVMAMSNRVRMCAYAFVSLRRGRLFVMRLPAARNLVFSLAASARLTLLRFYHPIYDIETGSILHLSNRSPLERLLSKTSARPGRRLSRRPHDLVLWRAL